jgi:putative ATPase
VLAHEAGLPFVPLSAVLDGVKELRGAIERAEVEKRLSGRPVLLFVDEIHRWNKAQQDALRPHLESGTLILVGATTENPSFEINAALRSRLQIVRLEPLAEDVIVALLRRALADPSGLSDSTVVVPDSVLMTLARAAGGDARRALDDLDRCIAAVPPDATLTTEHLIAVLQRSDVRHDRDGEDHFNVVSALIKSMRGSDPDAAIYWLARMIAAGEDPVFIARRLVVFAAEDVGNADPRALQVAVAALQAVQLVGMPEGRIPLAQAAVWLATCPKSNSSYVAIDAAIEEVRNSGALSVPLHLRNAPTAEMRAEGYKQGYLYPHDHPHRIVDQQYLPDSLVGVRYYRPSGQGEEKTIAERLSWWQKKLGRPQS